MSNHNITLTTIELHRIKQALTKCIELKEQSKEIWEEGQNLLQLRLLDEQIALLKKLEEF